MNEIGGIHQPNRGDANNKRSTLTGIYTIKQAQNIP
jgi:hypothetical protein